MSSKEKITATKEEGTPALVPKLRFPGFQDLPSWVDKPMGEVYSFKRNNSLSRDQLNYEIGFVKNIHYGDIHTKYSTLFDVTREAVPFINPSESLQGFRADNDCVEGDMIFADASEDLADIGKSIEIGRLNGERVVAGQHTILARPNDGSLAIGFGAYLFKSSHVRAQIQKESQGSKVLGISATRLAKIQLPIPPELAEQQKIAECLSSVDELMAAQARKVDALKTHKKGLMQQLFPREGETQPRLRFPEFQSDAEWGSDSLGNLFDTSSGGTPDRTKEEYWNGNIPWVTTSLVSSNIITKADEFITNAGLSNSSAKLFPQQTILVAMYGQGKTRGQVAMLGIKAATNQACAAILPRKDIDPRLVFQNLGSRYEELRRLSNSGGQENLSQGLVQGLQFAYPKSIEEQQRIANCLTTLDVQITAEIQKLDTLKTHKKGLMQQLFPSPEARAA